MIWLDRRGVRGSYSWMYDILSAKEFNQSGLPAFQNCVEKKQYFCSFITMFSSGVVHFEVGVFASFQEAAFALRVLPPSKKLLLLFVFLPILAFSFFQI